MTQYKPRTPGSFPEAICEIRNKLTADGAGAIIGVSGKRIDCAADSGLSNYSPLNIVQSFELDVAYKRATGRDGPILAASKLMYAEATRGFVECQPVVTRIGILGKEFGEALQKLTEVVSPESPGGLDVTVPEALEAIREIDDLTRELAATRADIARRAGLDSADVPPAKPNAA